MIRTFFHFRHEVSLREKRLIFDGVDTPKPVEVAPAPEPNRQEVQGPDLPTENSEAFSTELEATVAGKQQETQAAVQKQVDAASAYDQSVDAILSEDGTTREVVGMPPAQALEAKTTIDPAIAVEIQKLPDVIRPAIMQILEGRDATKQVEMKEFLGKISRLDSAILQTGLLLPMMEENGHMLPVDKLTALKNAVPAGAQNTHAVQAYEFFIGLNAAERGFVEKIVGVGKALHEKSKNAPPSRQTQAKIDGYKKRWESATTQEEKDLTEGFMLLEGATIDAEGNVTINTPPTFTDIVMGLFKVITAIFGKLGGKKTPIEKKAEELTEPKKEDVPADKLSPEARAKEITEIEADLKTSEETKVKLNNDVKKLKEEILTATAEAKPEMEKRLKGMQKQLAELEAAMAKKTTRLEELKKAEEASKVSQDPDKKTPDNTKEKEIPKDDQTPDKGKRFLILFEMEIAQELKEALKKAIKELQEKFTNASDDEKPGLLKKLAYLHKELVEQDAKIAGLTARLEELQKAEMAETMEESDEDDLAEAAEGDKADADVKDEKKLSALAVDYGKAEATAGASVANDIEYSTTTVPPEKGYIPYLEALLTEVADADELKWDSDDEQAKETALLQSAATAVKTNLDSMKIALEKTTEKGGTAYETLRSLYVTKSARLTELIASVDEKFENADLRNADMAAEQALSTIALMQPQEAIDWVRTMMATIDGNNWQSSGLKETYGKLSLACQAGLEKKLAEEKVASMNNPAATKVFVRHCLDVAKIFTGRTDIDTDLTNIDFAISMAKDAIGFDELAQRYQEKMMKKQSPLAWYLETFTPVVLSKTLHLPDSIKNNPKVQQMIAIISTPWNSIQEQLQRYAIVRSLDAMISGQPQPDIQAEADKRMSPFLEQSRSEFEAFLNGTWTGGGQDIAGINAAIGDPPLSAEQVEAWELLSDIQGYGYFNPSDQAWSTFNQGVKITAMVAAGIGVGMATGGLGIIGAALAGGAAMTATNAALNQQGFDDFDDAAWSNVKDLGVNTVTMGGARYLAAGRAAYQLSRGGLLAQSGGIKGVLKIAGEKGGGRLLASLDDASHLGTRLAGAGLEGSGDVVLGTSLDTLITGGKFTDNFKNNVMFFGLSLAEFGTAGLKKLRGVDQEALHGLAGTVNTANVQRATLQRVCGDVLNPDELMKLKDPASLNALLDAKSITGSQKAMVLDATFKLQNTKNEFEKTFKQIASEKGMIKTAPTNAEQIDTARETERLLRVDQVRSKYEAALQQEGLSPEKKAKYEYILKDLDIQESPYLNRLERAQARLKLMDENVPLVKKSFDEKTISKVRGKLKARIKKIEEEMAKKTDAPEGTASETTIKSPSDIATESDATFLEQRTMLDNMTGKDGPPDNVPKDKVEVDTGAMARNIAAKRPAARAKAESSLQELDLPQRKKQLPQAEPFVPEAGQRVWIVGDIPEAIWRKQLVSKSGIGKPNKGLAKIITNNAGEKLLLNYCDAKSDHCAIKITDEVMKYLAPAKNLHTEAVEALPKKSVGWKLRANLNILNPEVHKKFFEEMRYLEKTGLLEKGDWKIMDGGTMKEGKTSTIYVGDARKAKIVTDYLENIFSDQLWPHQNIDDIQVGKFITGRFEARGAGQTEQYVKASNLLAMKPGDGGSHGLSMPWEVAQTTRNASYQDKLKAIDSYFREVYGSFYDGFFPSAPNLPDHMKVNANTSTGAETINANAASSQTS